MTCELLLQIYFGQNMTWNWMGFSAEGSGKIIKVGDSVYVLQKVSSTAEAAAWTVYVESMSMLYQK